MNDIYKEKRSEWKKEDDIQKLKIENENREKEDNIKFIRQVEKNKRFISKFCDPYSQRINYNKYLEDFSNILGRDLYTKEDIFTLTRNYFTLRNKKENKIKEEIKETNNQNIKEFEKEQKNIIKKTQISTLKKLEEISTIEAHDDAIFKVSVFPSGNFVSVSSDKSIKIWNKEKENIQTIKNAHNDTIYYVSIKDENNFATCSFDNSIKIWLKKNNKFECIETINNTHNKTIFKVIYCINNEIISCSYDKTVKIWSNKNKKNYECIKTFMHKVFVNTILLLEDKNILISAGWDGTYFWDLSNYNLIIKIKNSISLSSNSLDRIDDDRIIVGGGNDHIMKVINVKEKKIVFEFDNIFRCYGVLIIKDKDIFITSGMSNNLRIYSIKNFNCLYVEENAHNDTINGISKINNSKIITFSWDHNIKIWEINYEILNELNLI